MRVALYERVSTTEQNVSGFSIEHQQQRLEAYCHSQGWSDFEHYTDGGYSGTNMDRPQLKRLIRRIERHQVDIVIVYKLDRLSRKQRDVLYLLEDVLMENNVAFKSATEPIDTSTPLGRAMLGILAVFAQLERDQIIERTHDGQRTRVKRGLWPGGIQPFGYKWNKDAQTLEIVPAQADLVREVYKRFLNGDSYLSIANWMKERTSDRYVDHGFIKDILTRPTYAGTFDTQYGTVEGEHERIIDMDTWQQAQEELEKRKRGRKAYGKYLLSGLLVCGHCGDSLQIQHWKRRGYEMYYYACNTRHMKGKHLCENAVYFRKEKLEAEVIAQVRNLHVDPSELQRVIDARSKRDDDPQETIAALEQGITDIDRRLEVLTDALLNGTLPAQTIKTRSDALQEERSKLTMRIEELQAASIPRDPAAVLSAAQMVNDAWDEMTFDERRTVMRTALDHVEMYKDRTVKPFFNV